MFKKPSEFQMDALREHLSIGVGHAASTLNSLVGKHVELELPQVDLIEGGSIEKSINLGKDQTVTQVTLDFTGNINGKASTIFDKESAARLVNMLVPEAAATPEELDAINESTITEVGNIVINSVMGSLSNCLFFDLDYCVPEYSEISAKSLNRGDDLSKESVLLFGETFLIVENERIEGKIFIFFFLKDIQSLLESWIDPESDSDVA